MVVVDELCKNYGKFHALDGLSFQIQEGELFGFVGPNGAGKTTTMKILAGLLRANSGTVLINGVDVLRQPKSLKGMVGYIPDYFGVYDNLSAIEYMEFFASIYGLKGRNARKTCLEKMDMVHLTDKENVNVDVLSRGQKQRLCLARCLLFRPKLLLLDEPASGMDPRGRKEMCNVLRELSEDGTTMLISSHLLSDLSEICTSIGVMEDGKLVTSGSVDEVMAQFNRANPIVMDVVDGHDVLIPYLKENEAIETISTNGSKVYVGFQGNKKEEAQLLRSILAKGVLVSNFGRAENDLESLYMQITESEE